MIQPKTNLAHLSSITEYFWWKHNPNIRKRDLTYNHL